MRLFLFLSQKATKTADFRPRPKFLVGKIEFPARIYVASRLIKTTTWRTS